MNQSKSNPKRQRRLFLFLSLIGILSLIGSSRLLVSISYFVSPSLEQVQQQQQQPPPPVPASAIKQEIGQSAQHENAFISSYTNTTFDNYITNVKGAVAASNLTSSSSSSSSLAFPPSVIFLNGNPQEPQFLWTYSLPRFLRQELSRYIPTDGSQQQQQQQVRTTAEKTEVYVNSARDNSASIWKVLEKKSEHNNDDNDDSIVLSDLDGSYVNDLQLVTSKKQLRKEILPLQKIIFTRATTVTTLIELYPQFFRFCDRHNINITRDIQENNNNNNGKDSNDISSLSSSSAVSTCPVIVHFPTGRDPCPASICNDRWHYVLPDNHHAKPMSPMLWKFIFNHVVKGIFPPSSSSKLISLDRWNQIRSSNCTVAYVSAWSTKKGQERFVQELEWYVQQGWISTSTSQNDGDLQGHTFCFGGNTNNGNAELQSMVQNTFDKLKSLGIQVVNFGWLSLVEQVLLFHASGRSILWTNSDHSPRVVYLALASGAAVLTSQQANIAKPILDTNDPCFISLVDLDKRWEESFHHYYYHNNNATAETETKTIQLSDEHRDFFQTRAKIVRNFLSSSQCSFNNNNNNNNNNTTSHIMNLAYHLLSEDFQYRPLLHRALDMWRSLNDGSTSKGEDCIQWFAPQCEKYRKHVEYNKKKRGGRKKGTK